MSEEQRETFQGWAILELMGHRRLAGFVSEQQVAGAAFVRIDVPAVDGADATQFYSPSSVYCITPCGEQLARDVAHSAQPRPVNEWDLPRRAALEAGEVVEDAEEVPF